MRRASLPDELETVATPDADAPCPTLEDSRYRALVLSLASNGAPLIVGAVALVRDQEALRPVSYAFLERVARGIYDAGDVKTVYFRQAPG